MMRIDNNAAVNPASRVRPKGVLPVDEPAGAGVDSMELSSRAADVRIAMEALKGAPEVREERVAELGRQMEQGTLTTNGDALANKLLRQA